MATVTRTTTTVMKTTSTIPRRLGPARGWLKTLGWLSILLGILGLIAFVVDLGHQAAFHLEDGNMLFHWVVAIACLVTAYALRAALWLGAASIAIGSLLIAAGFLGFLEPELGAWHAGVGDNVLHLLLGIASVLVGIVSVNRDRDFQRHQRTQVQRTA